MKLTDKLGSIRALRAAVRSARPVRNDLPAEADLLVECIGAEVRRNHYGEYLHVRQWFDSPEACDASRAALDLLAPGAPAAASDPANWLFLDTETTGLAGGTAPTRFWWAWRGSTRRVCKSSSISCAT